MAAAFFALAGALIGVAGTLLTALVGARREERRARTDSVRRACIEFLAEVGRLRDLSHELHAEPGRADLREATAGAHISARASYARLRLTSETLATQEAGRWLLHYGYWQWQAAIGNRADFREAQRLGDEWTTTLVVAARRELGLSNADDVFAPPAEGLPVPTAPQRQVE
ncbi:hypothetical protein [Actinoplanes sp. N902-109]|uniref:hypothetical protein n=1 Tax=Actinoplanes sp. (strain N902-109) TaxID=649831 RepID=UPI0005A0E6AC|nr:hypothetical protein [Actinoplanes sp. N902-109]